MGYYFLKLSALFTIFVPLDSLVFIIFATPFHIVAQPIVSHVRAIAFHVEYRTPHTFVSLLMGR